MKIHLLTIGQSIPAWIKQGYEEYAKRLPLECALLLTELPAAKRYKKQPTDKIQAEEAERLLNAIPKNCYVIALDEHGILWNTQQLTQQLSKWQQNGSDIALLVGGADGLSAECKKQAKQLWSLSPLTLPHGLVRILIAEQIYRAWSIQHQHPYHRL